MPQVSVIIPSFNQARFLERRLRSVLEQTISDIEVIFIDDGSADNSKQVFAPFASDPRVRAVFNPVNSGNPFAQWNHGVKMAKGRLIWIAEADDYADSRFLEVLLARFTAHPQIGLAYCQSELVDANDKVMGTCEEWTRWLDPDRWRADYVNNGREECARYLIQQNTIPNASAVVFRRDLFLKAGMADETMKFCGDWITWVRLLLRTDLAFVAEPLNHFRRHGESVTAEVAGTQPALQEHLRIVDEILQNVEVPGPHRLAIGQGVARLHEDIRKRDEELLEVNAKHAADVYERDQKLTEINRQLQALSEQHSADVVERDQKLERLNEQVREQTAFSLEQNTLIHQQAERIAERDEWLRERDAVIERMNQGAKEQREEMGRQQQAIQQQERRLQEQTEQLMKSQQEVAALREQVRAQEQAAREQTKRMENLVAQIQEEERQIHEQHEKIVWQSEKMKELKSQIERIQAHPLYRAYRWVRNPGRRAGESGAK